MDDDLVGRWSTEPYDYGVMESGTLCFRPAGTGYAAWANAGGGIAVTRFGWTVPAPGHLRLRVSEVIGGAWADSPDEMTSVHTHDRTATDLATGYRTGFTVPPGWPERVYQLDLDTDIEWGTRFARTAPAPPDDDPARRFGGAA
ncbi:hypothetical protein GCM10010123_03130 [Pilimelia anulata]|uniref:Uncharacterized protein n=1 Tax=Pilimelia anulata TaxID=53371 RepID=A0A8J3AYT5_9ACTN|nr:hypothetical protein [Pilimelia anulata]GGJ76513.1 hypothetical protein GCM10010123_03130 [Pilimelia anulata]